MPLACSPSPRGGAAQHAASSPRVGTRLNHPLPTYPNAIDVGVQGLRGSVETITRKPATDLAQFSPSLCAKPLEIHSFHATLVLLFKTTLKYLLKHFSCLSGRAIHIAVHTRQLETEAGDSTTHPARRRLPDSPLEPLSSGSPRTFTWPSPV